jgi:hypothetical protein
MTPSIETLKGSWMRTVALAKPDLKLAVLGNAVSEARAIKMPMEDIADFFQDLAENQGMLRCMDRMKCSVCWRSMPGPERSTLGRLKLSRARIASRCLGILT